MQQFNNFIQLVNNTRSYRKTENLPKLDLQEKQDLLQNYHPDNNSYAFTPLSVGNSKGQLVPNTLNNLILTSFDCDYQQKTIKKTIHTKVLVIGGGGAGMSAVLACHKANTPTILVTKLRLGDGNTVMAEGGIQIADGQNDSAYRHFLDTFGGGQFTADTELVKTLVQNAKSTASWLRQLGVDLDRTADNEYVQNKGGGTSVGRMHCAKDYTGLEISRVLKHNVKSSNTQVFEFTQCVQIITKNGTACGGIMLDGNTNEYFAIYADAVIVATGGCGQLNYQGFPTSNGIGATADGVILCYKAGASLVDANSLQFHPTGIAHPKHLQGKLVTEKARSLGAQLVSFEGKQFINSLETRDAVCASIIKQCKQNKHSAVFLDIPMIDLLHGKGTIKAELPNMYSLFSKANIDITTTPILVYPTLHYQNGGVKIDSNGMTAVKNLYAIGEVAGGIHGKNRLMGNSLLDILVFGRIAGNHATSRINKAKVRL